MTTTLTLPTPIAELDEAGHLLNPVLKDFTKKAGRFGFRGDIALKFAQKKADEKRPPEISTDQVMMVAENGKIPFFTGFLLSFEYLALVAEVLGSALTPEGKYFVFCDNIDLSKRYTVAINGIPFYVLPIDEATVYNETLELLYLEKNDLKKLDTAGKLDKVADAAAKFSAK
ncbi:MAG: hypothetical protein HGA47_05445, partial [Zoogloea sp.]|nr:hypothetical protein [Zoogloea sp.]